MPGYNFSSITVTEQKFKAKYCAVLMQLFITFKNTVFNRTNT